MLHDHRDRVAGLDELVDLGEVEVAQAAAQPNLAPDALRGDLVEAGEDLDGDLLAELAVVGEPHRPLAAVAEDAQRLVPFRQADDQPLDRGPVERLRLRPVLFPCILARHAGPLPPSLPTAASYTRVSPTPRRCHPDEARAAGRPCPVSERSERAGEVSRGAGSALAAALSARRDPSLRRACGAATLRMTVLFNSFAFLIQVTARDQA